MSIIKRATLVAVLCGVFAAPAAADQTTTFTGHIASERPDWVYVPFDVPSGTNQVDVSYSYNRVNGWTSGCFDNDGIDIGNNRGFRSWSGGARTAFSVSASDATPGYRAPSSPGAGTSSSGPTTSAPPESTTAST